MVLLGRAKVATVLGVLLGAGLTSTMVVRTTQAVFAGTDSGNQTWSSGGASISGDGSSTAAFNAGADTPLVNGTSLVKCMVITYAGRTTPADVRLYAAPASVTGNLAPYLDMTIETGSSTSVNGNCAGFVAAGAPIYTGTLSTFGSTKNSFGTGAGTWAPSVINEKLTYRFTMTVQNSPAAQNQTAAATFIWEAQTR
jgi:hypothetical protein